MSKSKMSLLDRLFHQHRQELMAFAGLRGGSETSEDLVQEAYLRLMQHPNLESIENARAFLYQTIANLSIDQHRRQTTRDRFHRDEADIENELVAVVSSERAPEDQLAVMQELQNLNEILLELPDTTRNAFVLFRLEGLPHKEIGRRLGISERNSVRLVKLAAHHLLVRFGSLDY